MPAVNNVYAYRMPAGIPGRVNREQEHTGEPNQLDATTPPTAFGDAVKMGSNGRIQALAAGDAATAVYGLLEAGFPGNVSGGVYNSSSQLLGNTVPTAGGRCTIMKRGYMTVQLQGATAAAKGGLVYIRLAGTVPTGGRLQGYEAAADSTNTILLTGAYFMGAADSSGNVEVAYNL